MRNVNYETPRYAIFLSPFLTCCFLGPNILFSFLFWNALNLRGACAICLPTFKYFRKLHINIYRTCHPCNFTVCGCLHVSSSSA